MRNTFVFVLSESVAWDFLHVGSSFVADVGLPICNVAAVPWQLESIVGEDRRQGLIPLITVGCWQACIASAWQLRAYSSLASFKFMLVCCEFRRQSRFPGTPFVMYFLGPEAVRLFNMTKTYLSIHRIFCVEVNL